MLDLGCGHGEFINQVSARRRLGMDLNPESRAHLVSDVEFLEQDCTVPWAVPSDSLDVVFTSNFFEHLPDKAALGRCLGHALDALKPGGRLIALGPNIAAVHGVYWHFWDHYLPLTNQSLAEGLRLHGYLIELAIPQTLPYTMVNALRYPLWMLALYLHLPIA